MAICGHRCGLLITATTAIPEAVRIGLALSLGKRIGLRSGGTAAIMSTRRGNCAHYEFQVPRRVFWNLNDKWDEYQALRSIDSFRD